MMKTKDGCFMIQSYALPLGILGCRLFLAKSIWNPLIPYKICFLRLACQNRVPTLDLLIECGMVMPNRCAMCGIKGETTNHSWQSGVLPLVRYDQSVWHKMGISSFDRRCMQLLGLHGGQCLEPHWEDRLTRSSLCHMMVPLVGAEFEDL